MARAGSAKAERTEQRDGSKSRRDASALFDTELSDLPPDLRWREWMKRAEAVIFASAEPVGRETIARVVGRDCAIELLIDDLREDLRSRPYDIVAVAGGWQHRTRPAYAAAIRAAIVPVRRPAASLSRQEAAVLTAIAFYQPVTRGELSRIFGKEISRDTIAALKAQDFIATGPRSPTPGAPYTYVTTPQFLAAFGFATLRDLPDIEMLEDAGLLSRHALEAAQDEAADQAIMLPATGEDE
jgi:segregation and condensation protein B